MRTQTQKIQDSAKTDPVRSSRSSTPQYSHPVLQLQQQLGNQAVQRLLQSRHIQAKLTIGQPNDKYEQEADRIADQVLRMPDPSATEQSHDNLSIQTPVIQRVCTECEEELQRQPTEEIEEEELLQAKEMPGQAPEVSNEVESTINTLRGGGQPLSKSVKNYMEPRFSNDFSQVRVHTDSHANKLARSINARAFTFGKNIVFGSGHYSPETGAGKRLLAHELTHVIQQSGDDVRRVQCQEEPEKEPIAAETPTPSEPAEEATETESCALTTFVSDRFINKTPVIDVEFKASMETIESYAKNRDVKVYVTDHFRAAGTSPSGAIVTPATKSNHKAGHAIDMNVKHGANHYNSTKLKKSNLNAQPAAVKGFIQDIRDDSDLRWGGDFSDEDPVHIDDHLNANNDAWQKRFDATQDARKKGCG